CPTPVLSYRAMATLAALPAQPSQQQDVERMMQLTTGMVFTAALQPIARLKIADMVSEGPLPVSRLAAETATNEDDLYRVLRHLACAGVFRELPGKIFAFTSMSQLMRCDGPGPIRDLIVWIS